MYRVCQTQLGRLQEQMEQEWEDRQSARTDEARTQEQTG